ncbi:LAME_0F02828g1_1 [Lachancea meyersii CBS 8951]|uniref:Protein STU1 n=1 Tax=Lachancea meyersii CBS 8951 TaxID=1266667 RepID=A0A1G4JQU3_9SACH|nr:LAME_0F02828g1_1 [Lachancea meyersii CBS 8951]
MSKVRRFALHDVLTSDSSSEDQKLHILAEFKGHVKKELVYEPSIPHYFECLCAIMNSTSGVGECEKMFVLCHSTLCYLVKRVAMQCPAAFDADTIRALMVPLLRTVHLGSKIWLGSVKALEAVYLAQPSSLEQTLESLQLQENDRVAALLFTDELIQLHQKNNRNPLEILNKFTSLFLSILNEPHGSRFQDYELIRDILAKYYTAHSMQDFARRVKNPEIRQLLEVRPEVPLDQISVDEDENQEPHSSDFDIQGELQALLKDQIRTSLPTLPRNFSNIDALRRELEHVFIPFTSPKETEHNWRQRQEAIIVLRGIIAGNASLVFTDEVVTAFKDYQISDCISKAVSSLRTSLSMHGCQLVKEMANRLQVKINPIADGIFHSLKNVLSATKKIASQNAFHAACVLLASMHFHSRTFQSCFLLSKDKNVSPRCYAAIFLRIFLIRFNSKLDHCVIYIDEWINRSATDAQTKVRESMRVTFWYYYKIYPTNAQKLLDGFPPQIRRAVESSIPKTMDINYLPSSTNSTETSRRSSLGPARTPSYAGPTQSSHLQRLNSLRTSNGHQPVNRNKTDDTTSRKASGSSKMAAMAPRTNSGTNILDRATPPGSIDGHAQIDLTGEITQNHSNTLIKKYMEKSSQDVGQRNHTQNELDDIIHYLSSKVQSEKELGIQLLQNICLIGLPAQSDKLRPAVALIIMESPQSLAPLLRLPAFHTMLNASQAIEAFAVHGLPVELLTRQYTAEDLLLALKNVFDAFYPVDDQLPLHYLKYGRQILDYGFDVLTYYPKGTLSVTQPFFKLLTERLLELYGKDFNLGKYFDALFCIYACDSKGFMNVLEASSSFLQSNVRRELEKRGPEFDCNVLEQQLDNVNSGFADDGLSTQLTMINPSFNQRSASGSSVLIHDLNKDEDENMPSSKDDVDDELLQDAQGFTKFGGLAKLTELTRVVSLYEHSNMNNNSSNGVSLDTDGDFKMRGDSTDSRGKTPDVDLSDIFNEERSHHKDVMVKFDDQPRVIQQHLSSSEENNSLSGSGEKTPEVLAPGPSINSNENRERTETQVIPTSKEVGDKVVPENVIRNVGERQTDVLMKAPILLKTVNETEETSDFFDSLSSTLALQWALSNVAASSTVPYRPGNLLAIIAKIKKRSFTGRDLNMLLSFLIIGRNESTFLEWFQEDGLHQLLEVQDLLLKSMNDTDEFPEMLASKCLLLSSCLLILESALLRNSTNSSKFVCTESTWACTRTITSKLDSFDSECYVLCEELREYMINHGLIEESDLPRLTAELDSANESTVRTTFALASLRLLSGNMTLPMDKTLLEEIATKAVQYIVNDAPELRKESTELLGNLYRLIQSSGEFHWQVLERLPRGRAELISSLSTNGNA